MNMIEISEEAHVWLLVYTRYKTSCGNQCIQDFLWQPVYTRLSVATGVHVYKTFCGNRCIQDTRLPVATGVYKIQDFLWQPVYTRLPVATGVYKTSCGNRCIQDFLWQPVYTIYKISCGKYCW
jgi:hypothetical protein